VGTVFHASLFVLLCAASAAVITSITQVGRTSKAIVKEISPGEGQAMEPARSPQVHSDDRPRSKI
jgi:hypothetical protein